MCSVALLPCWCLLITTVNAKPPPGPLPLPTFAFSAGFSDDIILQRSPARAAIFGFGKGPVTVSVSGTDAQGQAVGYTVSARCSRDASVGPVWKAFLEPQEAGGDFTVTARRSSTDASSTDDLTMRRVTFGDVYVCSGQSNQALASMFTFSIEQLQAEIIAGGKYKTLRLFQYGGMQFNTTLASNAPKYVTTDGSALEDPGQKWWTPSDAARTAHGGNNKGGGGGGGKNKTVLSAFSATCLYFGVELLDALGNSSAATPVGLIQSAVGGSTIEAWMSNETREHCTDEFLLDGNGKAPKAQHIPGVLYYGYITPFVNMTVGGFLWYQAENNCAMPNVGNFINGSGYGCELSAMVAAWRKVWSHEPGSTAALAPFGIATLAAGGSEGNPEHMSAIRWSQQANFGRWNTSALPMSFGAQLYDVGDPWGHAGTGDGNECLQPTAATCRATKCCDVARNATDGHCAALGQKKPCGDKHYCANVDPATGKYGPNCSAWNASLWWGTLRDDMPAVRKNAPSGIPALNFMGGIHPRLKRPAGRRLAAAAVATIPAYAAACRGCASQGPTLAGCTLQDASASTSTSTLKLVLHFNATLLGNEKLLLRPFETDMTKWAFKSTSSGQRIVKADSAGLMVCVTPDASNDADAAAPKGNATTCGCRTWAALNNNPTTKAIDEEEGEDGLSGATHDVDNASSGKDGARKENVVIYCQDGPGWKPPKEWLTPANKARAPTNPFASQWLAVPLLPSSLGASAAADIAAGVVSVAADLGVLKGRRAHAVRLGWPLFTTEKGAGKGDDMCCTSQEVNLGLAPCVPGGCPLYSSESELVANPFFAAIGAGGKCACAAPQVCDA